MIIHFHFVLVFQDDIQEDLFSWIYQEKFGNDLASVYLERVASSDISRYLDYFISKNLVQNLDVNHNSAFGDQLIEVLLCVDRHFQSNVFRRMAKDGNSMLDEDGLLKHALSPLPSFHLTG